MKETLGSKLSVVLSEIQGTILEHEVNKRGQPKFSDEGFMAAVYIFSTVLLDKAWDYKKINKGDGEEMGQAIKLLVKTYTGIDMHVLVKEMYD